MPPWLDWELLEGRSWVPQVPISSWCLSTMPIWVHGPGRFLEF